MAEIPTSVEPLVEPPKPRLRGRLHQVAFMASIPAGLVLVALAERPVAKAAAVIYAMSLIALFGTSASYHVGRWSTRALRRMRRLDHSMIFVLIAGTYTPIALLGMHGVYGIAALVVVWAGAIFGIAIKLARIDGFQVLSGILYIGLGWVAVFAFPQVVKTLSLTQILLILAGGLLYTGGAIVLATHKPNPNPRVFGYHEVWHTMGIAAGVCHYVAILMLTMRAA